MTIKEHSTMKRLLGILEGMGYALPDNMQEAFQETIENLNDHIDDLSDSDQQ